MCCLFQWFMFSVRIVWGKGDPSYSLACKKCIHNQEMELYLSKLLFIAWIIVSLKKMMNDSIKHDMQQFKIVLRIKK